MSETLYTDQHEWIRSESGTGIVGISVHAAGQLGDVVFVELPAVGRAVVAGEQVAVVESVKAASEVFAPAGGVVTEINTLLTDEPGQLNLDPEGEAWLYKLTLSEGGGVPALMNAEQYAEFIKGA